MKMTKCLSLPALWDIEVIASRSLSGQELGQALGPWSAKQCGFAVSVKWCSLQTREQNPKAELIVLRSAWWLSPLNYWP